MEGSPAAPSGWASERGSCAKTAALLFVADGHAKFDLTVVVSTRKRGMRRPIEGEQREQEHEHASDRAAPLGNLQLSFPPGKLFDPRHLSRDGILYDRSLRWGRLGPPVSGRRPSRLTTTSLIARDQPALITKKT